ncbi:MAG: gamma-glutamyl-gamma-aminobutyrate hydrolase family protein [Pseudomonadota bacterium]|nr:gamma-glutamyl-gamma-aminobutyrate hydrolase family protein [Pseudomonadota bacterium]
MENSNKCLGYVLGGTGDAAPFDRVFTSAEEVDMNHMEKYAAVVLWGGEDISPSLYGQRPGRYTGAKEGLSARDRYENEICQRAMEKGIPLIGVCRGAQLLCALAGGSLFQHVKGHGYGGMHYMHTTDDRVILSNSLHHQMMNPKGVQHELLAWVEPDSDRAAYYEQDDLPVDAEIAPLLEPEVVYFPTIRGLAIQGHPEFTFGRPDLKDFVDYSCDLVAEYLLNKE